MDVYNNFVWRKYRKYYSLDCLYSYFEHLYKPSKGISCQSCLYGTGDHFKYTMHKHLSSFLRTRVRRRWSYSYHAIVELYTKAYSHPCSYTHSLSGTIHA